MSRYSINVKSEAAVRAMNAASKIEETKISPQDLPENYNGRVWIGYDRPCYAYFLDFGPDCEIGYWYGSVGLTRRIGRWDMYYLAIALYRETGSRLFSEMASAIALDVQF